MMIIKKMFRYIKYFDYMWINSFINIDLIIYVFIIYIVLLVIIFFRRLMLKDLKYKNKWYSIY